ncbi:MAG: DUF2911 domain-containing protein [Saprospiraceae bacterium]
MKKILTWVGIILASLAVVLFVVFKVMQSQTKKHSPEGKVAYVQGETKIDVFYNRPSVKGRKIVGGLLPYGEVWRTGANEATTFTTNRDLLVAGKPLAAGKYTLWTIPNQSSWKVIFNKKQYGWGVGFDRKASRDPSADVLQVDIPAEPLEDNVEMFTISLDDSGNLALVLAWEKTKVSVPLQ